MSGGFPQPERIEAILRHAQGPRILDIGCSGQEGRRSPVGSTWWLHGRLRERFPEVNGLEYSASNAAALHDAGFADVFVGDAQTFDLGRQYDTVVAGELIEHLGSPASFLDRVAAHLRPGGRLIVTTPYAFSFLFVAYAWLRYPKTCSNDEHVSWYCPTTFRQLVERHGWTVEAIELVEHYRPDLPSWAYRAFLPVYRVVRRLLPRRVRSNSMVAVLTRPAVIDETASAIGSSG